MRLAAQNALAVCLLSCLVVCLSLCVELGLPAATWAVGSQRDKSLTLEKRRVSGRSVEDRITSALFKI